MSSIVDLIVLASSAKNSERCVAGIDVRTGEWVRPVGSTGHGEVPFALRNIKGQEPEIFDIVRMELEKTGETHGFQMENRAIVKGPWERVGRASSSDVLPYCCNADFVFYDDDASVRHADLRDDVNRNSSLQLWEVHDFTSVEDHNFQGAKRWKGSFSIPSGQRYSMVIKDLDFEERLNQGHRYSHHCLLLLSLGAPFLSRFRSEPYCWKLIATVIEL